MRPYRMASHLEVWEPGARGPSANPTKSGACAGARRRGRQSAGTEPSVIVEAFGLRVDDPDALDGVNRAGNCGGSCP